MKPIKKMWGGRFEESPSDVMTRMGESISFDRELYKIDILASKAHALGLVKSGILSKAECKEIHTGLEQIQNEIESGSFVFTAEKEDIHMHIESRLTELVGETGKKLHTARSRNDQVSQDVRLYILQKVSEIEDLFSKLLHSLYQQAEQNIDTIFPGYTHLQIAQPIRASHYFLAHFWAFSRDLSEFQAAKERSSELVLGSGALAGVNYKTDRSYLQKLLGLKRISENSMDAVSQRDHILKLLFAASQFMVHVSRFSEEVILYTSQEFGYFKLPDSLTTGSSIMPQKKNPDIAELMRGKSARVFGALQHILVLMKGTPLAYNRDFQEDKIALFDAVNQTKLCLEGMAELVAGISIQKDRAEKNLHAGFATATDLADWLVKTHKIPFRESHEIVGNLVKLCSQKKETLETISEADRVSIHPLLSKGNYKDAISLSKSCDKKDVYGGTALNRQKEQLNQAKSFLKKIRTNTPGRKK